MYTLNDIRKIGWIGIGGGMLAFVVGVIAQILVGFQLERVLVGNVATYFIIGSGWFFASGLVNASVYQKIATDNGRRKVVRLKLPPQDFPPAGKFGLNWLQTELAVMALWAVSILLVQLVLGQAFVLPVGGFAGGYLAGSGLARLRFISKAQTEETEQRRTYYFGDSLLSSRTEMAYYTDRTDDPHPIGPLGTEETSSAQPVVTTAEQATPPGVKRRAGSSANKQQK